MSSQRKSLRLRGFDYSDKYVYHVTICSDNKKRVFTEPNLNSAIIDCLQQTKIEMLFDLYVYCLMPNHIHLLVSPNNKTQLSAFVRYFKGRSSVISRQFGIRGKIWQRSYYDHILRKEENVREVAEYILNNPVRKGLSVAREYPYADLVDDIPI